MDEPIPPRSIHQFAYRLRVVASYDNWRAGQEFPVERSLTIGRGTDCDVVLADVAVSRRHACVEATPAGLKIQDLDSGNGIWIGAQRVSAVLLGQGQRFQIGSTQFECVAVPRLGPEPNGAAAPSPAHSDATHRRVPRTGGG